MITDDTEEKNGQLISRGSRMIENIGTFIIENGVINQTFGGSRDRYIDIIKNSGEFKINGGTITSSKDYIIAINGAETGNITIAKGNITLTGEYANTINIGGTKNLEITGGDITTTNSYSE